MPNGYTADIVGGKDTSAAGYLRRASRGFGFAIYQRDDDDSDPVKKISESSYSLRRLAESNDELARFENLTEAELLDEYNDYVAKNEAANAKSISEANAVNANINYIREGVQSATWPERLKEMSATVVKWLDETQKWDGRAHTYDIMTYDKWYEDSLRQKKRDISYYTEELAKDRQRVIEQNAMVDLFEDVVRQVEEWEAS